MHFSYLIQLKKVVIGMSQVQPIEGITPSSLWTTVGVLLGLAGIAIVVFKIIEFYWKAKDRKDEHKQLDGKGVTDVIAEKVMAKLEPRLEDMEKKLTADKNRLDNHEASIRSLNSSIDSIKDGMQVTADALSAILDHELHNGNTDQMQKARDELQKYTNGLIKKV